MQINKRFIIIAGVLAVMLVIGVLIGRQAIERQVTSARTSGAVGQAVAVAELVPLSVLAIDPRDQSFLTATSKGIYRSTDGGKSWQGLPVPATLAGAGFSQVVVNPDNPSVVYASGRGTGVIRSDDGGQTWRSVSQGLPGKDVDALAIHSFRRDTLYAWVKGQGLFRTEDGGGSWKRMDAGPDNPDVAVIAHSTLAGSMNTGWVYAGTPEGAYLSMD